MPLACHSERSEESRTAYFQELTRFFPSISLREAEAAGAARSLVGRHGDLLRMTVSEASDREFFRNLLGQELDPTPPFSL